MALWISEVYRDRLRICYSTLSNRLHQILLRCLPCQIAASRQALSDPVQHSVEVQAYLQHRADLRHLVYENRKRQKEDETLRYNRRVNQVVHVIDSLAMLYQKRSGILEPRWTGPSVIDSYSSERHCSHLLRQFSGRRIKGKFHGDHLKRFILRPHRAYRSSTASMSDLKTSTSSSPALYYQNLPRPHTLCWGRLQ